MTPDFARLGYVRLQSSLPAEWHDTAYKGLVEVAGHISRATHCALPDVDWHELSTDPVLVEAFTALLGARYRILKYCGHTNPPGSDPIGWHRDLYEAERRDVARCFYYPQLVTPFRGPLSVLPGSHTADAPCDGEVPLVCEAGTFFVVHPALIHRQWANVSDLPRFMVRIEALPE